MNATEAAAAGAGVLHRLRRHAGDAAFLAVALVLGFLLWPSSLGGCTTLTIVSGHSMEPLYYTGDLVVSRCGDYQVGDVVVYNPPDVGGARVIHRIIGGNGESGWVMQGDNNDFVDPWEPTNDRVLGKAMLHVPQLGRLASVLLSPLTWLSLLLVALALVIWPSSPRSSEDEPEDSEPEPAHEPTPAPEPVTHDSEGTDLSLPV